MVACRLSRAAQLQGAVQPIAWCAHANGLLMALASFHYLTERNFKMPYASLIFCEIIWTSFHTILFPPSLSSLRLFFFPFPIWRLPYNISPPNYSLFLSSKFPTHSSSSFFCTILFILPFEPFFHSRPVLYLSHVCFSFSFILLYIFHHRLFVHVLIFFPISLSHISYIHLAIFTLLYSTISSRIFLPLDVLPAMPLHWRFCIMYKRVKRLKGRKR